MVIEYYSGTLINTHLPGIEDVEKRNGEGLMSVSFKKFQIFVLHFSFDVEDKIVKSYHAWILPAECNTLR